MIYVDLARGYLPAPHTLRPPNVAGQLGSLASYLDSFILVGLVVVPGGSGHDQSGLAVPGRVTYQKLLNGGSNTPAQGT